MQNFEEEEEGPVVAPEFDFIFLMLFFEGGVGEFGGYVYGEYGENEALN